ncbi:Acetyltransferase (GNAT) family protein [Micromonospora echinaurantiaca]|uniref:Acetyltransferase (GNAT) family protein n=1 Tax=Micromonospora echinaurantiaca TaxID=47857 RepID=A0A1C5KC01_9ACTN|nr:GNAT family N-acetyltransferase [Micromonospora echinaurantiaca]SCG80322.1 Acetyltransferase (GNAT) family protein [Micromonospora echinaurantiaca]
MAERTTAANLGETELGGVELGGMELGGVELGGTLRALRRRADLSQRELAAKAGVPQATLARIESGRAADPRFRTVLRLVRAAGGELAVGVVADERADAPLVPVPPVPHDDMRDEADRRYPAHLDVREVRRPRDWPGAWWASWCNLPPRLWPCPVPAATYDLDRGYRDRRRQREEIRRAVRLRRVWGDGLPTTSWRFVAELPDGELVGELRAHERSPHLFDGEEPSDEREIVLDGVLVAAPCRGLGIGRRLVELLTAEMERAGVRRAHAVAELEGVDFLLACGYQLETSRPSALRFDLPRH